MVELYRTLLLNLSDPFMRYIEFVLRSAIYRNIVHSLEDKFAFLFKHYSNSLVTLGDKPKFMFWRAALSMWAQQLGEFHQVSAPVWRYITGRMREQRVL